VQKVFKIAAYALGGLFCVALGPQAGAQCTLVGSQVICTQDFGTFTTDTANKNLTGTLDQFNPVAYSQPGFYAQLNLVTLTLTGTTTASGTLQNTSATTTETYNITQLVSLSGSGGGAGNNDLTIGAFNSQFGPQSLTLAAGATGNYGGTGTGTGSAPTTSNAAILADFTGAGTFTVKFNTGAAFTSVTGGTDFLINGNPTEDVVGTVSYTFQLAPVPELSSSLGLAALVLAGGALGLRARRRAQA